MKKFIITLCVFVFLLITSSIICASDDSLQITTYTEFIQITGLTAHGDYLWIGTCWGGIYCLNRHDGSYIHYDRQQHDLPRCTSKLVIDGMGVVWAGLYYLSSFKEGTWEKYEIGLGEVTGIAVDKKDLIWRTYSHVMGDGSTSVEYYNGKEWVVTYITYHGPLYAFRNLAIDSKDRFWVIYRRWDEAEWESFYENIGLYENGKFSLMDPGIRGWVTSIIEDTKGAMWFTTNTTVVDKKTINSNGVWKYDGDAWINYSTENSEMISNNITTMVVDKYDRKWFGTDKGLVVFDGRNWITYTIVDGLTDNIISAITIDDDDNLWIGTDIGLSKFSILDTGKYIRLISPFADDEVPSGGLFSIVWLSGEVEKILLEYSNDGGVNWYTIEDNLDATRGSYSWNVPEITLSECLVRISDYEDSLTYDVSVDNFSISYPSITLLTPNGNEQWVTNFMYTIEWDYTAAEKVNLEYSVDNGTSWLQIVSNVNAADRFYNWTVPELEHTSKQCFIRISDALNPAVKDLSNTSFSLDSIKPNALSFTSGGYIYINTLQYPIRSIELWIQFCCSPSDWRIKSTWEIENIDNYSPPIKSNIYAYEGITNKMFSKIRDKWYHVVLSGEHGKRQIYVNGEIVNEEGFRLYSSHLSIGESFYGKISEMRVWSTFLSKEQIRENMYKRLDDGEGLTSAFHMTGGSSENIFYDSVGRQHGSLRNGYQRIESDVPLDRVHLLSPQASETWEVNTPQSIRWEDEGFFESINIEYSQDGGSNWLTIADHVEASTGSYEWTPDTASSECLLRIVNAENSGVLDATGEPFVIDGPTTTDEAIPLEFSVSQNSPNPFNPFTTITFTIPEPGNAAVVIYNIMGQKIATLVNNYLDSGQHTVNWDASGYSSGIYLCRVVSGKHMKIMKMLLMK